MNEDVLRRRVLPPLYQSGVQFRRERPGREEWDTADIVLDRGWGDCEDLSGWRIGELRRMGIDARPEVKRTAERRFHAVVRWPGGAVEDPSRVLRGLEEPMAAVLGADSIIRWRVRRVGPGAFDGEVTIPLDLEATLRAIARPPERRSPAAAGPSAAVPMRASGGASQRGPARPGVSVVDAAGTVRQVASQPVPPQRSGAVTTRRRGRSFGGSLRRALGTALRAASAVSPIAGAASSLFGGMLQGDDAVLGAADAVYPAAVVRQLRRLAADLLRER